MIELNDLYDYGLKIYQNKDYFKFSLDSILLGEFISVKPNDKILDMCTGNAPIPLIITTKEKNVSIDAVEIQDSIYSLAKKSVVVNDLESTISIHNVDIHDYTSEYKYDVVTCNPPYFKVLNGKLKNKEEIKSIARHEVKITLEDVITLADKFLNEKGTFYMVQRVERFLETIDLLRKRKMGIRKVIFIKTKENKNAELFLIEASKAKKDDIKVYSKCIDGLKTYQNIFKEG